MICWKITDLPRTCHRPATHGPHSPHSPHSPVSARLEPGPTLSCNSSGTAIAVLRASRAYQPARWHRFVSIERREPLQTSPQGTSARAMICRKSANLPRTAVSALFHAFPQFTWHGNRHSTGLQGIFARAMALICVHRAPRTPPDSTPGHIGSRDGIDLCPSSAANPSRQHSRAHPLARWHRFESIERPEPL